MDSVQRILSWFLGLTFALLGLLFFVFALFDGNLLGFLGAVSHLLIALLLLPPIRKAVHNRTQKTMPLALRLIAILAILALFFIFSRQFQNKKDGTQDKNNLKRQEAELEAQETGV